MAWQAGNAQGVFLVGTIIQILISLHDVNYTFPQWHTTLLAIAAVGIAYVGNVYGHKYLHLWQNTVFALHVLVYFAFLIPIWVNAPRASSKQVWTDFTFSGGWHSAGLSVLVGQQTGIFTQIGIDTVSHGQTSLPECCFSTLSRLHICQKRLGTPLDLSQRR